MGAELAMASCGCLGLVGGPDAHDGLALPYGRRIILMHCHVAGTSYLRLESIEPDTQPGDALALLREPQNPYDELAILVLDRERRKLGYVPRDVNEAVARLMDAGKLLTADLASKEWQGSYLRLWIRIYLEDI